jgi:hypothetical protein
MFQDTARFVAYSKGLSGIASREEYFFPLKVMNPLSGTTMPRMHFIKVVLPLPLGPTNAIHSPLLHVMETSSKAVSFPKRFVRLLAMIIKAGVS